MTDFAISTTISVLKIPTRYHHQQLDSKSSLPRYSAVALPANLHHDNPFISTCSFQPVHLDSLSLTGSPQPHRFNPFTTQLFTSICLAIPIASSRAKAWQSHNASEGGNMQSMDRTARE